jgi:uncharacterized protein (TIGR00251 family)
VLLSVRVTPRAGRTAIAGMREGVLHVKLAAAPVEGAANAALIDLLSRQLRIPKRSLRIATGERSRTKTVEISGLTDEEVRARLAVRPN